MLFKECCIKSVIVHQNSYVTSECFLCVELWVNDVTSLVRCRVCPCGSAGSWSRWAVFLSGPWRCWPVSWCPLSPSSPATRPRSQCSCPSSRPWSADTHTPAYTNPTPKPTPYRKLSAFLDFQKTSFCMIYKLVSSWGPKNCSHKDKIDWYYYPCGGIWSP